MKVHLTGSAGFIGGYLLEEAALAGGFSITATDREEMDVTDAASVRSALERDRPDALIHLAALCGAAPSRERPDEFFLVNAAGTVNVLEACRRAKVDRFILVSSLTVHGQGDAPRTEDSPHAPRHPYAASKSAAEQMTCFYSERFGLTTAIVRPSLVVGPGAKELHAIGSFVETALAGRPIELQGDGSHRRDFIHPRDVARACALCLRSLEFESAGTCSVYNISNGEAPTMRELAELVRSRLDGPPAVAAPRCDQTFSLFTTVERARDRLGFSPRFPNSAIIDEMIRTLKEHAGDVQPANEHRRHHDQHACALA